MQGESHEHEEESHDHHEHSAENEAHEHDEGHSDFEAHYKFSCNQPESLGHMTVKLFERFLNTEKLNVQLITTRRQGAAVLTADNPRLDF
jgi:ABC-type Zn2+ transport system substrate-binding protein/surface adhesin